MSSWLLLHSQRSVSVCSRRVRILGQNSSGRQSTRPSRRHRNL